MKTRLVFALIAWSILLQGCAGSAGVAPDAGAQAADASTPVAQASAAPGVAIPEQDGKPVIKADTKEDFEAIVAAIHQQMQPGGRWQYIDQRERDILDNSFADMDKLYVEYGNVAKMDRDAQMRVVYDQNTINTILTKKDGERLICTNEIPVGTHLPVKTCKTYAQVQAEERSSQEYLRKIAPEVQQIEGH